MPKQKCLSFKEIFPTIQRLSIYQTHARIYIIGSDLSLSYYRLLKIDRTEPKDLVIDDDNRKYTEAEINEILRMIDGGNINSVTKLNGLQKTISSFGIVGFVRFLEGYYVLLITRRRKVAIIGGHSIYKIEDAVLTYLPPTIPNKSNPEESRYVKTFLNVDLSSNFYFSYTYDLTNTLQTLMRVHPAEPPLSPKFIWNSHLLKDFKHKVNSEWVLPVVHGFISQNCINVFGRSLYITLIARRSSYYAGTRYMKRGMDDNGNVANEVETEQIVYECSTISHSSGKYTSFVQLRGSVPGFWSQDIQRVMPKPPIRIDRNSPFFTGAAKHFNSCLARYGSPVIIFNLVKKKEKRPHESLLSRELEESIRYLNQFLPPEFRMHYLHCDMARITRSKGRSIIDLLESWSRGAVRLNGFFHSGPELSCNQVRPDPDWEGLGGRFYNSDSPGRDQTGVVRVNCVDCLDRTNTAQFMIGKCALGLQLYALGVLENPQLNFDSDIVKMFEEMYEAHGDTIALQYGGSNLVHRIRTYRKISPITSHGRDIMQTVARYYNNAFADQDKQMAINLFLGVYIPEENTTSLWELTTDYYLHHLFTNSLVCPRPLSYTKWWTDDVIRSLPRPVIEANPPRSVPIKEDEGMFSLFTPVVKVKPRTRKMPALSPKYVEFYSPNELTVLHRLFTYTLNSQYSTCEYMPGDATDLSPFTVRTRSSGQSRAQAGKKVAAERKTIGGTPAQPSDEEDDDLSSNSSDSDTDSLLGGMGMHFKENYLSLGTSGKHGNTPGHASSVSTTRARYGFDLEEPDSAALSLYQATQQMYQLSFSSPDKERLTVEKAGRDLEKWIYPSIEYAKYSPTLSGKFPVVSEESMKMYSESVRVSKEGPSEPSALSMEWYYLYERPLSIPQYDPVF